MTSIANPLDTTRTARYTAVMIIGIAGAIGSGKDTVAQHLVDAHGFTRYSWAGTVKDCLAAIFSWDRALLEGHSPESRAWRETVDTWWANRLGIPHLTPRWVLQHYATDVMRQYFHPDIWVAALERKLHDPNPYRNIVVSDCRFTNELDTIVQLGGTTLCVRRNSSELAEADTHGSEVEWRNYSYDYYIDNNGTLDDLHAAINGLLPSLLAAR